MMKIIPEMRRAL